MELSWLTEHACPGQSFKEESPLSATFNYFCILEGKKKKRCLVPSECLHFRRDCQKVQSLKALLRVIMAALKLQISNDDIQPDMFTVTP